MHGNMNVNFKTQYVHYLEYVTEGHCDYCNFPLIIPLYLSSAYLKCSLLLYTCT